MLYFSCSSTYIPMKATKEQPVCIPNLASVIPAMDLMDREFTSYAHSQSYSAPICSSMELAQKTLSRYYSSTDKSVLYRIAMGKLSFVFWIWSRTFIHYTSSSPTLQINILQEHSLIAHLDQEYRKTHTRYLWAVIFCARRRLWCWDTGRWHFNRCHAECCRAQHVRLSWCFTSSPILRPSYGAWPLPYHWHWARHRCHCMVAWAPCHISLPFKDGTQLPFCPRCALHSWPHIISFTDISASYFNRCWVPL